jgi:CubicO group peptidase (beta-lactamase class C family)
MFDVEGLAALHDAMAARVAAGQLPGLVTLLARGDDVRVDSIGTYGFGDDRVIGRDTPMRVASLTKPVLAAVTMMLVEDGTLDLSAPVEDWLPELADRRVLNRVDGPLTETVPAQRPITVEDLLTFRMGFGLLTEPTFEPPFPIVTTANGLGLTLGAPDPRTTYAPDAWIERFASLPLMYQPGQRWQYNVGSLVLGVLVARAAGAPLGEVMRTRLFGPLGMVDTGFSTSAQRAAHLPPTYMGDMRGGPIAEQSSSPPEMWTAEPVFPNGSGGLLSTGDDYLAFARLLMQGGSSGGQRLLSPESVTAMTTNHLTPDQVTSAGILLSGLGWGYGMAVAVQPDEVSDTTGRYGWDGGSGTVWINDSGRDLIAIALSQTSDFLFNGSAQEFRRLAVRACAG